jgi:dihydropteroate synthase
MFFQNSPLWMAIINLSQDSFSDGGLCSSPEKLKTKCLEFVGQGAHILDFGGVATNPNMQNIVISPEEELSRIYEPIKYMRSILPKKILFSVDSFSPIVSNTLAKEGLIDIINDIYAAQKKEFIGSEFLSTAHVASKYNLGLVLMHMKLQNETSSLQNIKNFLLARLNHCKHVGVKHLAIDPGIGYGHFGKSLEEILEILKKKSIEELNSLGVPVLIGVSRKAFHLDLDATLVTPISRDKLTKEIEIKCIEYGAKIIRTHNMEKV